MGLLHRLWRARTRAQPQPVTPQIRALIERLLVLSPSLKLADGFRRRVTPALARSIDYVSGVVRSLPRLVREAGEVEEPEKVVCDDEDAGRDERVRGEGDEWPGVGEILQVDDMAEDGESDFVWGESIGEREQDV